MLLVNYTLFYLTAKISLKDTMSSLSLFQPYNLAGLELSSRIVMAPMTRSRATPGSDAPNAMNATYYEERATAGLIISEATQISQSGKGYAWTPGIYSREQIQGWTLVNQAVHRQQGHIFAQLWHVGRLSHPSLQPEGVLPVAPSAIPPPEGTKQFIESGIFAEIGTPRALYEREIKAIVKEYQQAAIAAKTAGFDGVEIHAANGYLIQQFLSSSSNHRTDNYGGSIANRTGIRISPVSPANGAVDEDPQALYSELIRELDKLNIAYVHVIEGATGGDRNASPDFDFHKLRSQFRGSWIVNNGYNRELAIEAIESGYADLVAFGKPFISNPDLVYRLSSNLPIAPADPTTFYGGDAKGYIDYPAYNQDSSPKG